MQARFKQCDKKRCVEGCDTLSGAELDTSVGALRVESCFTHEHLIEPMYDEHDLIDSPLSQTCEVDGHSVEIQIYRLPDSGWTLEVVDEDNNSTVWDGEFESDQAALDTALADIKAEGIEAFLVRKPSDLH